MDERPRARAGNAKDFFGFLETFHPGVQAHLTSVLPQTVMTGVVNATRIDWNDVETIDGPYVTAIVHFLGGERAREAWRVYTSTRFIHTPAIRALTEGAARLFGMSVGSFVRMIPFAFQQGFRGCGEAKVDMGANGAHVTMELVPGFARFPAYAVLFHGLFLGIYDILPAAPQLEFQPSLERGRIFASFRW